MPSKVIAEEDFRNLLGNKLGENYSRALSVFKNYGGFLSWDVLNIFLHAHDQSKTEEVLSELERHWIDHLQFQHPEIRGQVCKGEVNPTQEMFIRICKTILNL